MINYPYKNLNLKYLDLNFMIRSKGENDIIWLKEFLSPQFEVTQNEEFDIEIEYSVDDQLFEMYRSKAPSVKAKVNGFILDTKVVQLEIWRTLKHTQVLLDPTYNVFYILTHDRKNVVILAHSKQSRDARTTLMRIIREYSVNFAHQRQECFMHSAAFSYKGKGVLIAGSKNVGKTSSLIYFLSNASVDFVSNDRVLVCLKDDKSIIRGMPTIITVTENTLAMFPRFKKRFGRGEFHHGYSLKEIKNRMFQPGDYKREEFTLSPYQFCNLLKINSAATSELTGILFPKVSKETDSIYLERLSGFEAIEYLRTAQLGKKNVGLRSIFDLNTNGNIQDDPLHYEKFITKMSRHIPCYICHVGHNAFKDNRNAKELVQEIFDLEKVVTG